MRVALVKRTYFKARCAARVASDREQVSTLQRPSKSSSSTRSMKVRLETSGIKSWSLRWRTKSFWRSSGWQQASTRKIWSYRWKLPKTPSNSLSVPRRMVSLISTSMNVTQCLKPSNKSLMFWETKMKNWERSCKNRIWKRKKNLRSSVDPLKPFKRLKQKRQG